MGQFSWFTQDTDKQIGSQPSNTIIVYMYDDKGNKWKESDYEGYGEFGGKDFYDLLAEMNGFTKDNVKGDLRDKGIGLYFDKYWSDKGYVSPALMESETLPEGHSFELKPEDDPNQSWSHYADGGEVGMQKIKKELFELESESVTTQEEENRLIKRIDHLYSKLHKYYDGVAKRTHDKQHGGSYFIDAWDEYGDGNIFYVMKHRETGFAPRKSKGYAKGGSLSAKQYAERIYDTNSAEYINTIIDIATNKLQASSSDIFVVSEDEDGEEEQFKVWENRRQKEGKEWIEIEKPKIDTYFDRQKLYFSSKHNALHYDDGGVWSFYFIEDAYADGGKVEFNGWWDDSEESDRKQDQYRKKYNLNIGTKLYPKDDENWKAYYGNTPYAIIDDFGLRTPNRVTLRVGRATEIVSLEDIINNWKIVEYARGGKTDKRKRKYVEDKEKDLQRKAKPVGYRFKDEIVKGRKVRRDEKPTKKEIAHDKTFPPSRRKIYYEARWNRADADRRKRLDEGGKVDNYSEIETFVQLESDSDQNIRYMMVGTQGDKGFNGWIIDYGGGGNYDEFWFADGENLEGIVSEETNGDYDNDLVEEKFIERTSSGYLSAVEKVKEELIEFDDDYYPLLKSKPTHNHQTFNALTGETEGYLIPITVGNTIFDDGYADGGEVITTEDVYVEMKDLSEKNYEKFSAEYRLHTIQDMNEFIDGLNKQELQKIMKKLEEYNLYDDYAKGGEIGYGAYILRLQEDAHDKVIHDLGFDNMQSYLDDLNKREIGYAEFEEGYMEGEPDEVKEAIYTHSDDVVEELQSEGIAYKTYSGGFAKGGSLGLDSVKDTKEHLGFDDKEWNKLSADEKIELRRKSHKDLLSGKTQGYADKEDESLGMRTGKESSKTQSDKARREDSYGKWGTRDSERKGKDKKTKTTSTTGLAILGIVVGVLIGRQIKLN